jgi:DNA-binding ferritin-like protein
MKITSLFETKTQSFNDFPLTEAIDVEGINDHNCDQVIKRCLAEVSRFHVAHWKTDSYSAHEAVGGFYEGLVGLTDTIAEKFIALGGNLDGRVSIRFSAESDIESMRMNLLDFREVISEAIDETGMDKNIMSVNDSLIQIQNLIDSTIYKLDLI